MTPSGRRSYGEAIRDGFAWLLDNHPEVIVLGQGLWSPWYVGSSMTHLEVDFGRERVVDTPVSEQATTGIAVGAAVAGYRPIVVHPRMDFMMLAVDQIVTQAAKWSSMFGGRVRAPLVVRGIVNRGGEQGAQHSQSLHAWFAHIPGLRVALPSTPTDARDLLVSGTLIDDPVLFIDDRWLYDLEEELPPDPDRRAILRGSRVSQAGDDVTIVGSGWAAQLAREAGRAAAAEGISAEVIDLRVINPLDLRSVVASVARTGRLVVVDGGWATCGLAGEVIAGVAERLPPHRLLASPRRVTLQDAPAPTSRPLEDAYYPSVGDVMDAVIHVMADADVSTRA